MQRWWLLGLLITPLLVQAGGMEPPQVDGRAMDVGVTRYQGTLWRFVRFNTETDYPCLRFEAIDPDRGWQISARQDVCDIAVSDGEVVDFRDTAYTGFSAIGFNRELGGFEFDVEYIRRAAPGEQRLACSLPVTRDGRFGKLTCR
ncbi:hypothetical protein [Marinobacter xestospongiae]|uniref:hypothetical protein n=1 Tax=Marinobacter xestospongiae TaxID=994319 RepID=UPI0020050797|nr:hypothetical protein [Marinobacter xestospongiae]MCK7567149.1 hypothetical protein [Marinobacter xestospongiae]